MKAKPRPPIVPGQKTATMAQRSPVPKNPVFKAPPEPKIKIQFMYEFERPGFESLRIVSPTTNQILQLNAGQVARLRSYPAGGPLLEEIKAAIKLRQEAGHIESVLDRWQPTHMCTIMAPKSILTTAVNLMRRK